MTAYYLDTSALIKRYVDESGSAWLRAQLDPVLQPLMIISHLLLAEMTSAFNRRVREGALSREDYTHLKHAFQSDCLNEYVIIPVNQPIMNLATELLERRPLRALDALHLATALSAQPFLAPYGVTEVMFVSADDRLLAAAMAESLAVENPGQHP